MRTKLANAMRATDDAFVSSADHAANVLGVLSAIVHDDWDPDRPLERLGYHAERLASRDLQLPLREWAGKLDGDLTEVDALV
jgi:hypothetical protein